MNPIKNYSSLLSGKSLREAVSAAEKASATRKEDIAKYIGKYYNIGSKKNGYLAVRPWFNKQKTNDGLNKLREIDQNKALIEKQEIDKIRKKVNTTRGLTAGILGAGYVGGKKVYNNQQEKQAHIYMDAIEKVAGKVIHFPNGDHAKEMVKMKKLLKDQYRKPKTNTKDLFDMIGGATIGLGVGNLAGSIGRSIYDFKKEQKARKQANLYTDAIEKVAGKVVQMPLGLKRKAIVGKKNMIRGIKKHIPEITDFKKGLLAGAALGIPSGIIAQGIEDERKKY